MTGTVAAGGDRQGVRVGNSSSDASSMTAASHSTCQSVAALIAAQMPEPITMTMTTSRSTRTLTTIIGVVCGERAVAVGERQARVSC